MYREEEEVEEKSCSFSLYKIKLRFVTVRFGLHWNCTFIIQMYRWETSIGTLLSREKKLRELFLIHKITIAGDLGIKRKVHHSIIIMIIERENEEEKKWYKKLNETDKHNTE